MKGKELPPYCSRVKGVLYFRKRYGQETVWKKLEIQFPPGEVVPAALHVEIEALLHGAKPVRAGKTMADVITNYIASQKYRKLAPRTRDDYDKILAFHKEKRGHLQPKDIERRHVIAWRDTWAKESAHRANYRLRVLKILLKHALDLGHYGKGVHVSPAEGVAEVAYEKQERQPWPKDKIEAMRKQATGRTLLLFELLIDSGQRIGDVLKFKWGDIQDGGVALKQGKTKAKLWVPLSQHTLDLLDATEKRSVFILTNQYATGQWSYRGASQALRKARETIGALDYDAHSLRHTKASHLAELGYDDETIAAITGHKSQSMVKTYTASVRQIARAKKTENKT